MAKTMPPATSARPRARTAHYRGGTPFAGNPPPLADIPNSRSQPADRMRAGGRNMTVDETRPRVTPNLAYGICLVLLGGTLILDRMQLVDARQILQFWPLALVLVGAEGQSFNLGPAIALAVVGLVMSQSTREGRTIMRSDAGESASLFAVMSHNQQISRASSFRSADMTAVLGHSELDLRETTVAPGEEADIEVFVLMGATTIRVPEG